MENNKPLEGIVRKFLDDTRGAKGEQPLRALIASLQKEVDNLDNPRAVSGDTQARMTAAQKYIAKLNAARRRGELINVNELINSLKHK